MGACNKKGLAIPSKCQLVRFLQFTARFQYILVKRKVLFRLEAELCRVFNRGINHLVCQFSRTILRLCLAENSVTDFTAIASRGKTCMGKRIFESQAELIDKVEAKTDITIRLLSGHKNLYKSRLLLFPVGADAAFQNGVFAGASNNALLRKRC